MSLDKILKDFKEDKIDKEEAIAALNKHFDVCSCELGDVYKNKLNDTLVMVLTIENNDVHFIDENGHSDYESIHQFEEYHENENRNVREHWESFVNAMNGVMVNAVVPLLQLNEPGRNRCVYTNEDCVQEDKDWEQALFDLGLIKEC